MNIPFYSPLPSPFVGDFTSNLRIMSGYRTQEPLPREYDSQITNPVSPRFCTLGEFLRGFRSVCERRLSRRVILEREPIMWRTPDWVSKQSLFSQANIRLILLVQTLFYCVGFQHCGERNSFNVKQSLWTSMAAQQSHSNIYTRETSEKRKIWLIL